MAATLASSRFTQRNPIARRTLDPITDHLAMFGPRFDFVSNMMTAGIVGWPRSTPDTGSTADGPVLAL
jgi:hypothetical protein